MAWASGPSLGVVTGCGDLADRSPVPRQTAAYSDPAVGGSPVGEVAPQTVVSSAGRAAVYCDPPTVRGSQQTVVSSAGLKNGSIKVVNLSKPALSRLASTRATPRGGVHKVAHGTASEPPHTPPGGSGRLFSA